MDTPHISPIDDTLGQRNLARFSQGPKFRPGLELAKIPRWSPTHELLELYHFGRPFKVDFPSN